MAHYDNMILSKDEGEQIMKTASEVLKEINELMNVDLVKATKMYNEVYIPLIMQENKKMKKQLKVLEDF